MSYKIYNENPSQGILYVGKVPKGLNNNLSYIKDKFYNSIPDKNKNELTYHVWYKNLQDDIKVKFDEIRDSSFWKSLFCKENEKSCVIEPITEMDELYYSNTPNDLHKRNIYAAVGNYRLHIDFISFPGIIVNRVLVGMTPNKKTSTVFPQKKIFHKLNTNDFVGFDFGREWHKVEKDKDKESNDNDYRIMAKLHFIVCKKCYNKTIYFKIVKLIHVIYIYVSRYILKTGTNPKNLYQFTVGFILESVYNLTNIYYLLLAVIVTHLLFKNKTTKMFLWLYLLLFILIVVSKYIIFKISKLNKPLETKR